MKPIRATTPKAFGRLLDILLPARRFPRSDEVEFAHAVLLALWAWAASLMTLLAAVGEFTFGGSAGPGLLLAAGIVILELLYFRISGNIARATHTIIATQFLCIGGLLLLSGGRLAGTALVLPLLAFLAAVLLPRTKAMCWSGFAIASMVTGHYLSLHWATPWIDPDPYWVSGATFRVPLISTILAVIVGLVFTGVYRALIERIAVGRQRERELADYARAQELRIRTITENLPALISYVDRDQYCRFTNSSRVWPTQQEPGNPVGRHLEHLLGTAGYNAALGQVESALRGEPVSFEFSSFDTNGEHHHRAHFVPDISTGEGVRGFYSMAFDITEQKSSELRVNASERRMRLIADNVPVAISYIDADERYCFNNLMYERWFRRSNDQILLRPLREVLGERNYARIQPPLRRALAGETVEFEVDLIRDGEARRQRGRYTPDFDADGKVLGVIGMVQDVTELVRLQDDLVRQAHYDALTGLANRYLLYELLNKALRRSQIDHRPLAVLYLDLDRFKSINDSFGHAAGDAVLCEFAARLNSCKRATDVASRLSGDEFVLLLEEIEDVDGAQSTAKRIALAMEPPFSIQDENINVGVSIGVAMARPGDSPDVLLKRADRALYDDKARRAEEQGAGSVRLVSGN